MFDILAPVLKFFIYAYRKKSFANPKVQNLGVKSIQTHSARSVENTCPSSPYNMAEKKIITALLELKSCTKRCVCGSACVRLT